MVTILEPINKVISNQQFFILFSLMTGCIGALLIIFGSPGDTWGALSSLCLLSPAVVSNWIIRDLTRLKNDSVILHGNDIPEPCPETVIGIYDLLKDYDIESAGFSLSFKLLYITMCFVQLFNCVFLLSVIGMIVYYVYLFM